jgi:hypothetical protein
MIVLRYFGLELLFPTIKRDRVVVGSQSKAWKVGLEHPPLYHRLPQPFSLKRSIYIALFRPSYPQRICIGLLEGVVVEYKGAVE